MKPLVTLKAVALIALAAALQVGFLLQISVPSAEVLRASRGEAVQTTVARNAPALQHAFAQR